MPENLEIKRLLEQFTVIQSERTVWNNHYQILGEYIHQNKQNFETTQTPGEFLSEDIYDSTGTFAAQSSSSSLLGMLWPGSAKHSVEIVAPEDMQEDLSEELATFYKDMTDKAVRAMDDPRANLSLALDEYMLDQVVFGTSGVGVEKGEDSKLLFTPYGVKEMYIEEGKGGKVIAIWLLFEWGVSRVVDEYGIEEVSGKVRKKYTEGKFNDTVKILNVIRPRKEKRAEEGVLSMPVESLHIEKDSKHVLKESGFHELPIAVGRFRKLNYERYGRSPAMMALPDIREANALREAVIVATEKVLDMPKGVLSDGVFGGGIIDTSPKAINVFNDTGANTPIFDIGAPPNIEAALSRLEELKNSIAQHFAIDRLLDFNNEQQMTLGEANIRNSIRTASLQSLFARQIAELFTPIVERSVNSLFREGEFGVVPGSDKEQELVDLGIEYEELPEAILERLERGESVYEVRYKTQAAMASRNEDYMAILDLVGVVGEISAVEPTILNRIDMHAVVKEIGDIRSIPAEILRQDEAVKEILESQQAQAEEQQQLNQVEQVANIAGNVAPLLKDEGNAAGT